ncbi:argininosuccinate lyase [Falsirhodobacter sp. 20TX0035]|uniref:argininosuccinate lyase n=1 Tax=Falsirhodobacter sp. 20TX0035 TaxID=3022019 RepID=UPI00232E918B|nr:argininosuccinate lyase [Falsirhodobacter sp. 20TX0035]MDB6454379.1 argininosuccinate lyase [Falsirhodobacter sp. 20TX0035]
MTYPAHKRRQGPLRNTIMGIALTCLPTLALAQGAGTRDSFFWIGEINKASAVINTEEGLLDPAMTPGIAAALVKVLEDGNQPGAKRPQSVITFEPLLIDAGGQDVTLLHAGRSSQDMLSTARAAILRDHLLALAEQLNTTSRTMVELAARHVDTIVPNYTNGVAAQPNSYGHALLGHAAGLDRDAQRIREAYVRLDRSAMGTTVLNGTSWPLNRERMADYLGFSGVVENAYDAAQISPVDLAVELGSIVSSVALHSGSFIEDVMGQYGQTRPWILLREGGDNTYVSSAMPQKRNPGILNSTRSDASEALTLAMGPILQQHNLPPGMSDAKSPDRNTKMLEAATGTLEGLDDILHALNINPERAMEELNSDWTASQELADLLMREHGMPFRVGHHFASEIVTHARQEGLGPLDFPYAEAQRIYAEAVADTDYPQDLPITEDAFRAALDPAAIIRARATSGGPQPAEMERMLTAARDRLTAQDAWIAERRARIDDSLARLDADFAKLLP